MGFDFRMLSRPGQLPANYEPLYEGSPEYYQLTNVGMSWIVTAMETAGLLDEEAKPPDTEGVWPPPNMDEDRADWIAEYLLDPEEEEVEPPPTKEELETVRDAQDRLIGLLSIAPPIPGKVPAYKFMSNDGWVVTPLECEVIASELAPPEGYDFQNLPEEQREFAEALAEWARFNAAAALNGGYRVW